MDSEVALDLLEIALAARERMQLEPALRLFEAAMSCSVWEDPRAAVAWRAATKPPLMQFVALASRDGAAEAVGAPESSAADAAAELLQRCAELHGAWDDHAQLLAAAAAVAFAAADLRAAHEEAVLAGRRALLAPVRPVVHAAAMLGVCHCERLLGNVDEARRLLAMLKWPSTTLPPTPQEAPPPPPEALQLPEDTAREEDGEGEGEEAFGGASEGTGEGAGEAEQRSDREEVDWAAVDAERIEAVVRSSEYAVTLQEFLLELYGHCAAGQARPNVLLDLSEQLSTAEEPPPLVWRVLGEVWAVGHADKMERAAWPPSVSSPTSPTSASLAAWAASQHAAPQGEAASGGGDARRQPGGLHISLPQASRADAPRDELLSISRLKQMKQPDVLFELSIMCLRRRRPKDALQCLKFLLQSNQLWQPFRWGGDVATRYEKVATEVYERARWLQSAGLTEEAFGSLAHAGSLLEKQWRADGLPSGPLFLWLQIGWSQADMAEDQGSRDAAIAFLGIPGSAVAAQFKESSLTASDGPLAHIRAGRFQKLRPELAKHPQLRTIAGQVLLRRARLLLAQTTKAGVEPHEADSYETSALEVLAECSETCPSGCRDAALRIGNIAREMLVRVHMKREEHQLALASATALASAVESPSAPGAALHTARCGHLFSLVGDDVSAYGCYSSLLHNGAPKGLFLQHAASCMNLGRKFRRECLGSLRRALDSTPQRRNSQQQAALLGMRTKLNQLEAWQARYSLAVVYQQDHLVEQAHAIFADALAFAEGVNRSPLHLPPRPMADASTSFFSDCSADCPSGASTRPSTPTRPVTPISPESDGEEGWEGEMMDDAKASRGASAITVHEESEEWLRTSDVRKATLYGMASCMQQLGRLEDALEICQQIIKMDSEFVDALYLQGVLLHQLRRPTDAIAKFRLTLSLPQQKGSTTHVDAGLAIAILLTDQGNLRQAKSEATAVLEMDGQNIRAMLQHAMIRLLVATTSKDAAELAVAREELEYVVYKMDMMLTASAQKSSALAAHAWSRCLLAQTQPVGRKQQLQEAIEDLRRASSLDPSNPLPHIFRGYALTLAGDSSRPDEAENAFTAGATWLARSLPLNVNDIPASLVPMLAGAVSADEGLLPSHHEGESMATNLETSVGRSKLHLLADALHRIAMIHHRNNHPARAVDCYHYATHLANVYITASSRSKLAEGTSQAVMVGEALLGHISLNFGKLRWSLGELASAEATFKTATEAFDRVLKRESSRETLRGVSKPQILTNNLRGPVREQAACAWYNLGAALAAHYVRDAVSQWSSSSLTEDESCPPHLRFGKQPTSVTRQAESFASMDGTTARKQMREGGLMGLMIIKSVNRLRPKLENLPPEMDEWIQCFSIALKHSHTYAGGHLGLGTWLIPKHSFRPSLDKLSVPGLKDSPIAMINRSIGLHKEGGRNEQAIKELEAALRLQPDSIIAQFNLAQLLLLRGEWSRALHMLREVDKASGVSQIEEKEPTSARSKLLTPRVRDAKPESNSGRSLPTRKVERDLCAPLLKPLLQLCDKWQQLLWLILEDFREAAHLLNPHLLEDEPSVDEGFSVGRRGIGPPLTQEQLACIDEMIMDGQSRPQSAKSQAVATPPEVDRRKSLSHERRRSRSERRRSMLRPLNRPPLSLPSVLTPEKLQHVIDLQNKGEIAESERELDNMLRLLPKPSETRLGIPGALLYLWRSRTRKQLRRTSHEVTRDLRLALGHVEQVARSSAMEQELKGTDSEQPETGKPNFPYAAAENSFAASLLTELAYELEISEQPKLALASLQAARKRQSDHLVACNNAARLLRKVEEDAIEAMVAYVQVGRVTVERRKTLMNQALSGERDDDVPIRARTKAFDCASRIVGELEALLHMARTGFVGRPHEDGPPSEVHIAKQQGKLAVEMFEEQTRIMKYDIGAGESDEAMRRRQLHEVIHAQNQVLQALDQSPLRLYSRDKKLTTMLWGVERSSALLRQTIQSASITLGDNDRQLLLADSPSDSEEEGEEEEINQPDRVPQPELRSSAPTAERLVEASKLL